jgi:hypothetical protein
MNMKFTLSSLQEAKQVPQFKTLYAVSYLNDSEYYKALYKLDTQIRNVIEYPRCRNKNIESTCN